MKPGLRYGMVILLSCSLSYCDTKTIQVFKRLPSSVTGIEFENRIEEDDEYNVFQYMNIYTGAGVAAGDINNDGLMDLYFSGNMVPGRLYLNKGNLKFQDITETSGLVNNRWETGVSMVDINQDGWTDIYVAVSGSGPEDQRANLLYINNGDSTFIERAAEYGIAETRQTMHSAFLDYDGDNDLDLFLLVNPAAYEFNVNVVQPRKLNGESISTDVLYQNNGNGTFSDVSDSAGILVEGYGLGVGVSDINMDGWPDIYVSNDFIGNDILYINNTDGTFSNKAAEYLKHTSYAGMGNDVADFNNDGLVDIMVLDMRPEDNLRQKLIISSRSYDQFNLMLQTGYEPQYGRNTLQLNRGSGNFSEIGFLSGVSSTDWSWSALFGDYDNDGDRDLFITNGFMRDLGDLDYIHYQQTYDNPFGDMEAKKEFKRTAIEKLPGAALRDYLFENSGDLTFIDRSVEWGITEPGISHGAAYVDLDNDGDLELVVNNINEEAHIYQNRTRESLNKNYLKIELEGSPPNLDGIGAKIWLTTNQKEQYYEHNLSRGYESAVDPIIHFGIDTTSIIDRLKIEWPDGKLQIIENIHSNQNLKIYHHQATDVEPAPVVTSSPVFQEVTDSLGVFVSHQEDNYVDFKHQPILMRTHSQEGPGVATGDINQDGTDDLYIGGAAGYPGHIYIQQTDGKFTSRAFRQDMSSEDMGSLFFDADRDGDLDLYVVSGGSSYPLESEHYQDRLYLNQGQGNFSKSETALPTLHSSGSGVVAGDYDRDGDLDLFIGGRVSPQQYPMPARSYLLRNDTPVESPAEVTFTDVTAELGDLAEIGMVTCALWTDYDNDLWLDLVVTGEFMPIRFYHNEQGTLVDRTGQSGLNSDSGWWNSLVSGDFDQDGDTDYLAGNLGLNSRYHATPEEPLCIYASDYDKDGRLDPVMCYYNRGENYLAHSRDEIIAQINPMRARFKTYREYAEATFKQSFLPSELENAYVVICNNFNSSYLENQGGGKFTIRSLPLEAQMAPIYGMTTLDYNGDGYSDVLAVGNSYANEVTTGRYDASLGLVLQGNGEGYFTSVPVVGNGFIADGDAKGLAQLKSADGSLLVIVTNNSDLPKLFRLNKDHGTYVTLRPTDASAMITLKNGSTYKQELGYGSTYLSQSSRSFRITPQVDKVVITSFNGDQRSIDEF